MHKGKKHLDRDKSQVTVTELPVTDLPIVPDDEVEVDFMFDLPPVEDVEYVPGTTQELSRAAYALSRQIPSVHIRKFWKSLSRLADDAQTWGDENMSSKMTESKLRKIVRSLIMEQLPNPRATGYAREDDIMVPGEEGDVEDPEVLLQQREKERKRRLDLIAQADLKAKAARSRREREAKQQSAAAVVAARGDETPEQATQRVAADLRSRIGASGLDPEDIIAMSDDELDAISDEELAALEAEIAAAAEERVAASASAKRQALSFRKKKPEDENFGEMELPDDVDRPLSLKEIAELLGLGLSTVRQTLDPRRQGPLQIILAFSIKDSPYTDSILKKLGFDTQAKRDEFIEFFDIDGEEFKRFVSEQREEFTQKNEKKSLADLFTGTGEQVGAKTFVNPAEVTLAKTILFNNFDDVPAERMVADGALEWANKTKEPTPQDLASTNWGPSKDWKITDVGLEYAREAIADDPKMYQEFFWDEQFQMPLVDDAISKRISVDNWNAMKLPAFREFVRKALLKLDAVKKIGEMTKAADIERAAAKKAARG